MSSGHEGLNFDQEWPRTLDTTEYCRPCTDRCALRQKQSRWVLHRLQSRRHHFKNTDFICRAKPVLDGPHNTMWMLARPFEIEDRIHNMFEGFGARQGTILGDVSNYED